MLPFLFFVCSWWRRYDPHFSAVGVCAVLCTIARVIVALINPVGMDVALPVYCGYGMYCPFYCSHYGRRLLC